MNTADNNIKLLCTKTMAAHWGVILQEGKYYDFTLSEKEVTIITDYKSYYDNIGVVSSSIHWVRKGYTEENLHEVIPGYTPYKEINRLYTKRVKMPYITTTGDDDSRKSFYIMTDGEIMNKFNLDSKCLSEKRNKGHVAFGTTEHSIDEYFDYQSTRRDKKLSEICKKDQEK